ncbi:MAG: Na/Pi cotransporter family protein [Candidatus Woesearchaeota archaeon]
MNSNMLYAVAGFILFLHGIIMLSNSIQKSFSSSLRKSFEKALSNPLKGVFLGTIVTSIVQSSSAVTVIVIGLVNAGIISFYDSLGIIFGANIGTTITAQFVAFKLTKYGIYFMIFGFLLWFFGKSKRRGVGEIMFYFGLLFFGLKMMETGLVPLRDSPYFLESIKNLKNPLLGILIGLLFTAIIQSSSVTTSIVVVLGIEGLITLNYAIPIILGANIGTTVTALLASIGTSKTAKKSALAHFLFNLFGVLLFLPFLNYFVKICSLMPLELGKQIAMSHTIFNVTTTFIMLIFIKPFYNLINVLVRGEEDFISVGPKYLNKKLVNNILIGLELVKREIIREAELSLKMLDKSMKIIFNNEINNERYVNNAEVVVDDLQKEITNFLTEISMREMSDREAKTVSSYLGIVNDVERIADHATNLTELGIYAYNENINFSKYAIRELKIIYKNVRENVVDAFKLLRKYDKKLAKIIEYREQEIDLMVKKASHNHVERLKNKVCNVAASTIYTDILNNLERVSDHCMNIMESVKKFSE